jgi:hypothetical protein
MSEAVEKKDRSAAASAVVPRLFFLEANAGRIHSMGRDPDREPPFFFTKRTDAVVDSGAIVPCPPATSNFQYEIELVVAIGREGFDVSREAEGQGASLGLGQGVRSVGARRAATLYKRRVAPGAGRIWLAVTGVEAGWGPS